MEGRGICHDAILLNDRGAIIEHALANRGAGGEHSWIGHERLHQRVGCDGVVMITTRHAHRLAVHLIDDEDLAMSIEARDQLPHGPIIAVGGDDWDGIAFNVGGDRW